MLYPILLLKPKKCELKEFIDFWYGIHVPSNTEHYYYDRINKPKFTAGDIAKLFIWKNGMEINGHHTKSISVQYLQDNLYKINKLKGDFNEQSFQTDFGRMAAIWQIFLLHIIHPKKFPIFDQHVYRAYQYLQFEHIEEIPKNKKYIITYYKEEYIPFFRSTSRTFNQSRKVDIALKELGTFLKTRYARQILQH